ncbi:hypothetical protein QUA62_26075 [Microcoleus sp. MON1_C1]|uniref:hypothetical protein n=1 Tax=Microcoleus sp. MON1_C1 TaxID=2818827 RepID=UPI002FD74BB2
MDGSIVFAGQKVYRRVYITDSPAGAIEGEIAYISLYFVIFPYARPPHNVEPTATGITAFVVSIRR